MQVEKNYTSKELMRYCASIDLPDKTLWRLCVYAEGSYLYTETLEFFEKNIQALTQLVNQENSEWPFRFYLKITSEGVASIEVIKSSRKTA